MSARRIRIFIVDDHPLFRQGLKQTIVADSRFELIGEADEGRAATQEILRLAPDLAILDVSLPGASGVEIAATLHHAKSPTRVIILTMSNDEATFNHAMNLGVRGYLLKESAVPEIVNCLIAVASDLPYVSPALSALLLKRRDRAMVLNAQAPGLNDLTTAERRILKRIAEKKSTKEIAAELKVSPRTVETHRANISAKLDLRGNNALLQFAIEHRDGLSALK